MTARLTPQAATSLTDQRPPTSSCAAAEPSCLNDDDRIATAEKVRTRHCGWNFAVRQTVPAIRVSVRSRSMPSLGDGRRRRTTRTGRPTSTGIPGPFSERIKLGLVRERTAELVAASATACQVFSICSCRSGIPPAVWLKLVWATHRLDR
jgi:hypothetical protein